LYAALKKGKKLDGECETTVWNKHLGNSSADLGNLICFVQFIGFSFSDESLDYVKTGTA